MHGLPRDDDATTNLRADATRGAAVSGTADGRGGRAAVSTATK